jgi:ParB family chromosome partitioning protein
MIDTNIQRESILPSERAYAYKMKLEAIKRQGARFDLTSRQLVGRSETADLIGQDAGESGRQVQRYIRLTELIPLLLAMVDTKKVAFNPAVELSYLKPEEQTQLLDTMENEQATPSLSQAQRLKKYSQEGKLTADVMSAIMSEEKKEANRVTLSSEKLSRYFPKTCTAQEMESTIIRLLEQWRNANAS